MINPHKLTQAAIDTDGNDTIVELQLFDTNAISYTITARLGEHHVKVDMFQPHRVSSSGEFAWSELAKLFRQDLDDRVKPPAVWEKEPHCPRCGSLLGSPNKTGVYTEWVCTKCGETHLTEDQHTVVL